MAFVANNEEHVAVAKTEQHLGCSRGTGQTLQSFVNPSMACRASVALGHQKEFLFASNQVQSF